MPSYNAFRLYARCGISGTTSSPSTVYSMMDPKRKDLSILTIKKLCDGLDITITEFFNDEIFLSLEQEII